MYPINMVLPGAQPGFAVANDEAEHKSLSALGYEPPFEAPVEETVESVRAKLEAAGIDYDKRWGLDKLKAALAG